MAMLAALRPVGRRFTSRESDQLHAFITAPLWQLVDSLLTSTMIAGLQNFVDMRHFSAASSGIEGYNAL